MITLRPLALLTFLVCAATFGFGQKMTKEQYIEKYKGLAIEQMKKNIADALAIEVSQVNIKATTEEGLGFTGTGEGISSQAIASLDTIANYSYRVGPSEGGCAGCGGCMKVQES